MMDDCSLIALPTKVISPVKEVLLLADHMFIKLYEPSIFMANTSNHFSVLSLFDIIFVSGPMVGRYRARDSGPKRGMEARVR